MCIIIIMNDQLGLFAQSIRVRGVQRLKGSEAVISDNQISLMSLQSILYVHTNTAIIMQGKELKD